MVTQVNLPFYSHRSHFTELKVLKYSLILYPKDEEFLLSVEDYENNLRHHDDYQKHIYLIKIPEKISLD